MALSEEERRLLKVSAALDQYWESVELLYPYICSLEDHIDNGPLDDEYKQVAIVCARVVSWELSVRGLRSGRSLKVKTATLKGEPNVVGDSTLVEVKTVDGPKFFFIESQKIQDDLVPVSSWRQEGGRYMVFVPDGTSETGTAVFVPESEIIA